MASPIVQQIITAVEGLLTTGTATVGPLTASESIAIAGQKFQIEESISATIKKV